MSDGSSAPRIFFLCGQKGCGKTFFGRKVSQVMGIKWIDLDEIVLNNNPQYDSCRSLFRAKGESFFRSQELIALEEVTSSFHAGVTYLVSLGGGSCESKGLMELAGTHGRILFLDQKEDILLKRALENGIPPYLEGDTYSLFHTRYELRQNLYSSFADSVVQLFDCTEDQVVGKLVSIIGS